MEFTALEFVGRFVLCGVYCLGVCWGVCTPVEFSALEFV